MKNTQTPSRLLTEPETAELLQICHRTLVTRRQNGEIPFIALGKLIRYDWNEVVAHLSRVSPIKRKRKPSTLTPDGGRDKERPITR